MRKNVLVIAGVVLIAVGAIALTYRGIPYTSRDVVVDVGPITATAETRKTWPIPPIAGGLLIGTGVLLVIFGARKS